MEPIRIARLPEAEQILGYKRNTIYERVKDGLLTKSVSLGGQSVGWPINELAAINQARIAGRSDDEIRQLVVQLETARAGKPATPRRKQRTEQLAA